MDRLHQPFTEWASLFGPAQESLADAIIWSQKVLHNEITSFVPVHGRIAGYHVEPDEEQVPIQNFDPKYKEGTAVEISLVNSTGNISIVAGLAGKAQYFPHVNVDVYYEAAEDPVPA